MDIFDEMLMINFSASENNATDSIKINRPG